MEVKPKVKPNKDEKAYRQWGAEHDFCQACGIPHVRAPWPGLSIHHCVKPHRSHDYCNLLRLCHRDHRLAEGDTIRESGVVLPRLTLGITLTLKFLREPAQFDRERLEELYGRRLPDMELVPAYFEQQYRQWRPWDTTRFCRGGA